MFTGIIHTRATVTHLKHVTTNGNKILARLALSVPDPDHTHDLRAGASCAINGACLTLAPPAGGDELWFDLSTATLDLTTLGDLRPKQHVHFERALKWGHENGGHALSGHVDGTAQLTKRRPGELGDQLLTFKVPRSFGQYLIEGGYVALDGTSLTLRELTTQASSVSFTVNLIPETLVRTNFHDLAIGEEVNVEVDYHTKVLIQTITHALKILPHTAHSHTPSSADHPS